MVDFNYKHLAILGIRGIPAKHGGFETFAEHLSCYLIKKGWRVTVYCQEEGSGPVRLSDWNGITLVHIPVKGDGSFSSIVFDLKSILHSLGKCRLTLTLGYNTAFFNVLQRVKRQTNLINMDGIEWQRDKWGVVAKAWFWLNERVGCWTGNHLIADHPEIKKHLSTRVRPVKINMIPYGADEVLEADDTVLKRFHIVSGFFSVIIARPEPENSFLEIVSAFSQKQRDHKLVVLGTFLPDKKPYHRAVIDAASNEVVFPGAIYEDRVVHALRFFSRFYLHGHRVGGTNPSLVEALGAGSAVIAHDNQFNRWVAGPGAAYFSDESSCAKLFDQLLTDDATWLAMKSSSRKRFKERFTWDKVLEEYDSLLSSWHPSH